MTIKQALSALADFVMPRVCLSCGKDLELEELHLCTKCAEDIPFARISRSSHNPMADRYNAAISEHIMEFEPYQYACALFLYSGGYQQISQALKYHRNFKAGRYFASLLGEELRTSDLYKDVDLIIPVPLHWRRRFERGYNQAELIAEAVAHCLGDVTVGRNVLFRSRYTKTQTKMSGRSKESNVSGAFTAAKIAPHASHVLLIDDVFTTGSTLSECHKALRKIYGPDTRISIATLAFVYRLG